MSVCERERKRERDIRTNKWSGDERGGNKWV